MRIHRGIIFACLTCQILGMVAHAAQISLGALSYDTFIPAGGGSPGVNAFDIADLTGSFALPPDFPVADNLTFLGAVLTLTHDDLSQTVFNLGDIGPGFLLDGGGNPVVQVAGDETFISAELTSMLSLATLMIFDGTDFVANSGLIDLFLLPSSGLTLTADSDQISLNVSGAVGSSTPEPGSWTLLFIGLVCWILWARRQNQECA